MNPILISFQDALNIANNANGKKHLLLGNGFSIECRPDIFTYRSLLDNANFSSENIKKLFKKFDTQNFEQIIKVLMDSSDVLKTYKGDNALIKVLQDDADSLKQELVRILCDKHPAYPSQIEEYQYKACASFLGNFDNIYTLNYDLLLYWTLLQDKDSKKSIPEIDDGFRRLDKDYVHWKSENVFNQTIYYLHGALHLFDAGADLIKFTWNDTGVSLIDQISFNLSENRFPLFVAEGTSRNKLAKIRHSDYLGRNIRSISKIGGNLFIHGHSLADNDDHILSLIPKSKVEKLITGLTQNRKIL